MAEQASAQNKLGRFSSMSQIHWVAGLVTSVVLTHLFVLVVTGVNNQWALLILLSLVLTILAVAVGFAVRLTASVPTLHAFIAALVCAGLGVNVVARMGGSGFDDFGWKLISAYGGSPLTGYAIFFGLVAALVATVARQK